MRIRDPESFLPWIRDPGWKNSERGSGINILDPWNGTQIRFDCSGIYGTNFPLANETGGNVRGNKQTTPNQTKPNHTKLTDVIEEDGAADVRW
jgi:hypothetical protein